MKNNLEGFFRTKVVWTKVLSDESFSDQGEFSVDMAREAHLEAAKHHLEAASKHLAAVERYNEGDVRGAERQSEEAWVASQFADGKSVEAHRQAKVAVKMKLV